MADPAKKPRDERDEIEEILDELEASVGGDWSKLIHSPPPMTDEEWEKMIAEDEQWETEMRRQEAEWRAAHPDAPQILASDIVDEGRGPH